MALDKTDLDALRQLRTQSSPMPEDRGRIKAKLTPFLLSVPLPGSALSSPPSRDISATNPVQHGAGTTGASPIQAGLTTAAETGISSGGLVATVGVKIGIAVLCSALAGAAWVGVTHWGKSHRAPGVDSASLHDGEPMASVALADETMPARGSLSVVSAPSRTPGQAPAVSSSAPTPDRAAVEAAKSTRRVAAVRSKATGVPTGATLQAEIEALRAAQEALRDGNPQAALRQLEQREKSAQLARDRDGLRAVALCDANQGDAGRVAAEQFLRRYSSSALARRVRSACAKYLAPSNLSKSLQ